MSNWQLNRLSLDVGSCGQGLTKLFGGGVDMGKKVVRKAVIVYEEVVCEDVTSKKSNLS